MSAFDVAGARQAAEVGELELWVHRYLLGPGANPEFSVGLNREQRFWRGPMKVQLSLLRRTCGPAPEMRFRESAEVWDRRVRELADHASDPETLPPLIVEYASGGFLVNDGNHRYAALELDGAIDCWVILWYGDADELEHHARRDFDRLGVA